jgi:uncharacterized membrane protein YhhN
MAWQPSSALLCATVLHASAEAPFTHIRWVFPSFLGLGHLADVFSTQIIYLFFGLITVIVGVASYFLVSDSPSQAKFLSPEDRLKAVERLKANQQGKSEIATRGLSPCHPLTPFDFTH